MEILWLIGIIVVLMFCGVVAFGAPFLPTLSKRVEDAVELLDLKPGQTLLELGSGDGRLLKAVAKKGVYAIGYELNPILVVYTYLSTWRYRKYVTVKCRSYWHIKWPQSDAMYVFLLNPYMSKLHKKVVQYLDYSDAISLQSAKPPARNSLFGNFRRFLSDTQDRVRYVRLLPFLKKNNKNHTKQDGLYAQRKFASSSKSKYKVVSFAFEITEKKPVKTKNGMFLYKY